MLSIPPYSTKPLPIFRLTRLYLLAHLSNLPYCSFINSTTIWMVITAIEFSLLWLTGKLLYVRFSSDCIKHVTFSAIACWPIGYCNNSQKGCANNRNLCVCPILHGTCMYIVNLELSGFKNQPEMPAFLSNSVVSSSNNYYNNLPAAFSKSLQKPYKGRGKCNTNITSLHFTYSNPYTNFQSIIFVAFYKSWHPYFS